MKSLLNSYPHVVSYTDGSSIGNPGFSGAGVVFVGKKHQDILDSSEDYYSSDDQYLPK